MRKFFYPDSIVVVGASAKLNNLGRRLLANLHTYNFPGKLYAVGQGGGEVEGVPVLPSVADLPEAVDLAAILTPARFVPDLVKELGERGTKHAVILTGGFAEIGEAGIELQNQLVENARRYDFHFIGPNCFGLICPESGLALPFAAISPAVIGPGSLSILSQSGSVAMLTSYNATLEGVGIAKYVSIGNKLNLDEVDLLPYFTEDDSATKTVCFYLEGMSRGRDFIETAKRSRKPIVVLKSNTSTVAAQAAKSHTASLATDDRVVEGAFRQAGITRISSVNQFSLAAKALNLPPLHGDNLGVVSCTGGISVMAADLCSRYGFKLPAFSSAVLDSLAPYIRANVIRLGNPLDMGDIFDNQGTITAFERALTEPQVDGVAGAIFHFTKWGFSGPDTLTLIERIATISRELQKPVALTVQTEPHLLQELKQQTRFPIFNNIDECMSALAMLRQRTRFLAGVGDHPSSLSVDRDGASAIIAKARSNALHDIGPAAMELLAAYGLNTAALHFASTPEKAVVIAEELGYPMVLKAVVRELSHKSDVGGIAVGILDAHGVRDAFAKIQHNVATNLPDAQFQGVVVQKMVSAGQEIILGAKHDAQFGPVVMFGLGGVFTELFADVAFRLAPLTRQDAENMLDEVKGSRLLRGFRGQPACDIEALIDALLRLGQLIADQEEIAEVDVNPIKVLPAGQGAIAVDARVVLR